jgi:hypothetical protein
MNGGKLLFVLSLTCCGSAPWQLENTDKRLISALAKRTKKTPRIVRNKYHFRTEKPANG